MPAITSSIPGSPTPGTPAAGEGGSGRRAAIALVTSLFFAWGFLTVLNDILIPHLKAIFTLSYAGVMLVQFAFFLAYFLLALPSSSLVKLVGYKRAMVIGLVTMGLGALLFVPAAGLVWYPLFLAALFILASGMTILQVSANPYITQLGSPEGASSRLNLAQAFNSLGTMLAPLVGGVLILGRAARGASSVSTPYLWFAGALFALAVLVGLFRLPAIGAAEADAPRAEGRTALHSAWRAPHLVLGAAAIFVYCGAEVSVGSFLINFLTQPYIGVASEGLAAHYVSYFWAGAMLGRFVGSAVLARVASGKVLGASALIASALVWTTMLTTGHLAMGCIILVGLFNSIMFPTIFALAVDGLGPLTSQGSGILIMAILGAAILPLSQGALADRIGIHHAFVLPALCYLYVAFYGLKGCHHPDLQLTAARSGGVEG